MAVAGVEVECARRVPMSWEDLMVVDVLPEGPRFTGDQDVTLDLGVATLTLRPSDLLR